MKSSRAGSSVRGKIKLRTRKRVNYAEVEDVYDDIEEIQALVNSSMQNEKTAEDSISSVSSEDEENDALEALVQLIETTEESTAQVQNQKIIEHYRRINQYFYSTCLLNTYLQSRYSYYYYPPSF